MHQLFDYNLTTFEQKNQKFYQIVGEFYSQDQHYLIVSLDNLTNSTKFQNRELEIFKINGQSYGIIKADSTELDSGKDLASLLSGRELQIATLVALGRSNKQIAKQLQISEWTVSTHLRRIFAKLSVDSRAAMVYRCASLIHSLNNQNASIQERVLKLPQQ